MSDGPTRRETDQVRDNDGTVYDIEGDHAESSPGTPRDATGVAPGIGFAGGAGGVVAPVGNMGTSEAGSEIRSTSDSGLHGSVAEAADLGQRPLRDYKLDADTDTGGSAAPMSAGQSSSTAPVVSRVSDADASGGMGGRLASTDGTTILDTSRDQLNETTSTAHQEVISQPGQTGGVSDGSAGVAESQIADGPTTGSISASTDNTGGLIDTTGETLTNVHVGYLVVDANGDEIGKVTDLRSGDTSAVTIDDASDDSGGGDTLPLVLPGGTGTGGSTGSGAGVGLAGVFAAGGSDGSEPNVAEPAFSRLSRLGFIKIDAKGWFNSDLYAGADQIARVEGETVYLSAAKGDLFS